MSSLSALAIAIASQRFPKPPRRPPPRYSDIMCVPTHRYVAASNDRRSTCNRAQPREENEDGSQLMLVSPNALSNIVSPDKVTLVSSEAHGEGCPRSISTCQQDSPSRRAGKSYASASVSIQAHSGKNESTSVTVESIRFDAHEEEMEASPRQHSQLQHQQQHKHKCRHRSAHSQGTHPGKTSATLETRSHTHTDEAVEKKLAEVHIHSSADSSLSSMSFHFTSGDDADESPRAAHTPIGTPTTTHHSRHAKTNVHTKTPQRTTTTSAVTPTRITTSVHAKDVDAEDSAPTPNLGPPSEPSPMPVPCNVADHPSYRCSIHHDAATSKELDMWSARIRECASDSRSPILCHDDVSRRALKQPSTADDDDDEENERVRNEEAVGVCRWMRIDTSVLGGTELMPALPRLQGTHVDATRELRVAVTMDRFIARQPASRAVELLHAMRDFGDRATMSRGAAMLPANACVSVRHVDQRAYG